MSDAGHGPTGNGYPADQARYIVQSDGRGIDRLLQRQVAIEHVAGIDADDQVARARFLARLSHPGTVVVHDVVRGDSGSLLISDPPPGPSLAEAIADAAAGMAYPRLTSPADVAVLFIRLGDAVAAIHAHGVVHRALDARCVRLGPFGETAIGGWETAMASLAQPVTLRFVSGQAPAADLAMDGRHDDIRALGRLLLAALTARSDGPEALAPLSPAEAALVPTDLERIARHAAASDAASGYRTAEEFVADLRLVLDGRLPRCSAGTLRQAAWHLRRHRARVAIAALALCAAALIAWSTWGAAWLEARRWQLVAAETFADESWRTRWVEKAPRSFETRNGRLVTVAPREAVLICKRRMTPPLVVEYTGRVEPGAQACDLSLLWDEGDRIPEAPERLMQGRSLQLQLGAFDNSFSAIIVGPDSRRLAHSTWTLEVGRDYRVRVELDGERQAVLVDGRLLLEGRSLLPVGSGYLALYSYYPGKSFADLRILQRRQPDEVSPLVGGNAVFGIGRYRESALLYGAVADAHPGTALGEEAAYRRGLAERLDGRMDAARISWATLSDPLWSGLAECHQLEDLCESWQHERIPARFEELYRGRPALRYQLRLTWQTCLRRVSSDVRRDVAVVDSYLALRDRLFPDDASSRHVAGLACILTRRPQRVLDEQADDHQLAAIALLILGRTDELLAAPWAIADDRWAAHVMRGEYEQALALPRRDPTASAIVLAKLGRCDEALALAPDSVDLQLLCGQAERVLARRPLTPAQANAALLAAGRLAEAAGPGLAGVAGSGDLPLARLLLGLPQTGQVPASWRLITAAESGDPDAVQAAIRALPAVLDRTTLSNVFAQAVIVPMALRAVGVAEEPQRSWSAGLAGWHGQHGQRMWFLLSYALGGQADLGSLPAASEADAWTLVGRGLRAEIAGNRAGAAAAYAAFVGLPMTRRLLDGCQPDGDVEAFVAWRRRALGGP